MSNPEQLNPFASPAIAQREEGATGGEEADLWQASVELERTRGWVRLVALVGFLTGIITAVAALVLLRLPTGAAAASLMGASVAYVIMAGVYCVGGALLWKFAGRITQFTRDRTLLNLERAVESQATFWRFSGIVTLVLLVLYAVLLLGMVFVLA